jgi:hypothetical protein
MKKAIYSVIIIASIVFLGYSQTHYKREGKITDIVANNKIIIMDNTNNIWIWLEDTNNTYKIGDKIQMIMNNNYTDYVIEDDIIENIRLVK